MKLRISKHTIINADKMNIFLLYQPITRKGVLVEKFFLNEDINLPKTKNKYRFLDVSTFSLSDTLVDNPNGLLKHNNLKLKLTNVIEIIEVCKRYSIISTGEDYLRSFGPKESFFDKEHLGNFHQQIGEYVYRNSNKDSESWWIYQKFEKDLKTLRDNPYKWVQEDFLKTFFTKKMLSKKSILDFGCGIGFYSNFFAEYGADVIGIDPSSSYINIANELYSDNKNILFKSMSFDSVDDFKNLNNCFDFIFLSDVLLYFFVPYKKNNLSASELLRQLSLKLNTNGKIYILDPHGVFHLQPWFNPESPFLIASEYANKKYRVTPNLEEISVAIEQSGLKISKIRELKSAKKQEKFYNEFPFWWFFELSK